MVLLFVVLRKAYLILLRISAPLSERIPDLIAGFDGSRILSVCLIVLICFVSGLVFRLSLVRQRIGGFEEKVLSYIQGYNMIKAIATDALGSNNEHSMTTVLVLEGDSWTIGFLVEEQGDLCTVFIPETPRHYSGDIKIMPSGCVGKTNVTPTRRPEHWCATVIE